MSCSSERSARIRQIRAEVQTLQTEQLDDLMDAIFHLSTAAVETFETIDHDGLKQEVARLTSSLTNHFNTLKAIRCKSQA